VNTLPADVLIVAHTPSKNTQALAAAVLRGARHDDFGPLTVRLISPSEATADDVLNCKSIIIGSTENFGYMAGLIKDFFERIYYPCLEATEALPYALYVRAGNDGVGAQASIEKIVSGLKWKPVQSVLICQGDYRTEFIQQCETLGQTMAAGLEAGIF
jgi:flavorubredoxin